MPVKQAVIEAASKLDLYVEGQKAFQEWIENNPSLVGTETHLVLQAMFDRDIAYWSSELASCAALQLLSEQTQTADDIN